MGGKKNSNNIAFIECYHMYNFNERDLFDYIKQWLGLPVELERYRSLREQVLIRQLFFMFSFFSTKCFPLKSNGFAHCDNTTFDM